MMTELTDGLRATEAECAAGRTAPRVSLADIEANIALEYTFLAGNALRAEAGETTVYDGSTSLDSLHLLTIHLVMLKNGFTIIGKSAQASADNFDPALGAKLAKEDAVRQIWPLMGYALREKLAGG